MTVYSGGRLFFQSAATGCVGNGAISSYRGQPINVYDVTLEMDGCSGSFSYLNADFESLANLESASVWGYDYSVLNLWLSTPDGATPSAAITFWASLVV